MFSTSGAFANGLQMVRHMCDNKHCIVEIGMKSCCDMQWEDAQAHALLWENLNFVMMETVCPRCNL